MSATKFKVSIERVEKHVEIDVVDANSATEAYDYVQEFVDKLNSIVSSLNFSYRTITYHISKIEEKEETNE